MAVFKVLAVLLLAGTACFALPSRIVGGDLTTIETYPSLVQVDYLGVFSGTWGQSCAASILNNMYILSAAHCFSGWSYQPEWRRIRAGATFRNTGGQVVYITETFNHPTYGTLGNDGDINVVRLASPLTYSPVVQPGFIPPQGYEVPDGMPVVHAGWGAVTQGGVASPQLLDVTIYTVNHDVCAGRYSPSIVTENMICAGILDVGGKDACQGDSGGPMYYSGIIIGIVSWGRGCAQAEFPGVSTKVSPYTNWIVNTAS